MHLFTVPPSYDSSATPAITNSARQIGELRADITIDITNIMTCAPRSLPQSLCTAPHDLNALMIA